MNNWNASKTKATTSSKADIRWIGLIYKGPFDFAPPSGLC